MGAAGHIGRVGGLAVALGVGTAILTGYGVASAAPESDAGAGKTAESSSSATGASSTNPSTTNPSTATAEAKASGAKDAAAPTPTERHRKPTHGRVVASGGDNTKVRSSEPADATDDGSTTEDAKRPDKPSTKRSTKPKPAVAESGPATSSVATAQSAAESTVAMTSVQGVVDPGPGSDPPAPGQNPAALLLAAAARRETITGTSDYAPKVAVVNGVITGTNAAPKPSSTYTVITGPSAGGKVDLDDNSGDFTFLPFSTQLTPGGDEKFQVQVADNSPLVALLEQIPVLKDIVRPVVVRLHQIPIVGTLLSPIIGTAQNYWVDVPVGSFVGGNPIAFTTKVTSFDGTQISVNYFPALNLPAGVRAPTILNGPSLATAGYTNPNQANTVFGLVPGLAPLRADGYNVVTWDPRGEFASGGVLQLDSPDFEARDVSAIITWVAGQSETEFDNRSAPDLTKPSTPDGLVNNPLIGMVGGSYGGGIQLTSAGIDKRIDAIAPGIAWNNLYTTLYPNHGFKTSFSSLLLLSLVVSGARINPTIYTGIITGALLGILTPDQREFLEGASPSNVVDDITVPTLFLQGTVDDLFPLQQAIDNVTEMQEANPSVPIKMIWYCGGHGQCLDPVDLDEQTAFLTQETLDWMDLNVKYKGQTPPSPISLPTFQWVDQLGNLYSSDFLPTDESTLYSGGTPITVSGDGGLLPIVPVLGGSGPALGATFPVSIALGSEAINAINLKVDKPASPNPEAPTYVVGAPTVTLHYSGLGTSRNVYAQLVDDKTGRVLGNILTPIPVTLDGTSREITVSMEDIAYTMNTGDSLRLQIVASATPFENATAFGVINVSQVNLTLPTVSSGQVHFEQSFTTTKPPVGVGGLLGI